MCNKVFVAGSYHIPNLISHRVQNIVYCIERTGAGNTLFTGDDFGTIRYDRYRRPETKWGVLVRLE